MSAAFDTIDHELRLKTLKNSYGIDKLVLNWLSLYLNHRSFSVNINDSFSDPDSMLYSVPQGSILGPIIFILYTKHLQHIAHNFNLNIQLYADDTQLYCILALIQMINICVQCYVTKLLNALMK